MKNLKLFLIILLFITLLSCNNMQTQVSNSDTELITNNSLSKYGLTDTSQHYGNTFSQSEISDIYVEISDENWQAMLDNPLNEEYHSADITVNGETVKNVGIRTKGFSSLNSVAQSDSNRYGFRVKIDKYEKNQTLNGLDEFVLNASFADASYLREFLTYSAMAHLDGITPFINYTNLYINGELFGFYLCIESYDDSFIHRNTSGSDVNLYKANSESCTLTTSDNGSGFDLKYGNDKDLNNIQLLINTLNNTSSENYKELEEILDIDSVLKAVAVNTVLGNYDSYSGSKAHNYYLLYEDGKFSYIGWDYNMSIGGFTEDNGASVSVDISNPFYNIDSSKRPLMQKLLSVDEYYNRYLDYINSLIDYLSNINSIVTDIKISIEENIKNDPTSFYTYDEFLTATSLSDTDLSEVPSNIASGNEMPEGMQPPPNSNMEIPEGMQSPPNNNMDVSEGIQYPPYGQTQFADNMQNGIINTKNCSIIDYITQRIELIKSQLNL